MELQVSDLPRQQASALYHAALGRCIKTTARLMMVAPRTVKAHRAALMNKFRAQNTAQVVAEGFARGHLKYIPGFALCFLATLFSLAPTPASADDEQVMVRRSRRVSGRRLKALPSASDLESVDLSRPHDLLWDGALFVVYL